MLLWTLTYYICMCSTTHDAEFIDTSIGYRRLDKRVNNQDCLDARCQPNIQHSSKTNNHYDAVKIHGRGEAICTGLVITITMATIAKAYYYIMRHLVLE
jgi:hypothetical protein